MNIKTVFIYFAFLISFYPVNLFGWPEAAGVKATKEFNEGVEANIAKAILEGKDAGEVLIKAAEKAVAASLAAALVKAGPMAFSTSYGTLAGIGGALKAGAIVVAPWAAGSVALGAGSYYTYRHFYPYIPTLQEQTAEAQYQIAEAKSSFLTCLNTNAQGEMNRKGFPSACSNYARAYALVAGAEHAQEKIDTFKRYNSEGLE